jgi:hypothetical protein
LLEFSGTLAASNRKLFAVDIERPQLTELTEVIEDTVEYFCDQASLSGQLVWTVVHCLSEAKLAEFKGLVP